MGVFYHAEYDGDIFILIVGRCNQQIQDGCHPPYWIWQKKSTVADNIMQYLNYEILKLL